MKAPKRHDKASQMNPRPRPEKEKPQLMDINALFTDEGMRSFTDTVRNQHVRDDNQYGQIADIIERRLRQTPIEGDKWLSKWFRAKKVARQIRAMQKSSRNAASAAEALYATYKNEVLELPQRRQAAETKKLQRKQNRQAAVGSAVTNSLNKTATALNSPPQQVPGTAAQAEFVAPDNPWQQWPMAAGGERPTASINDYFPKGEAR